MIRYATGWSETIAPDEEARYAAQAEMFAALQAGCDQQYGESARTLHRKGNAGFRAEFRVRDDLASVLPPELQVGPFTPGAVFGAYVRLSNGAWDRRSDKAPDIRGVALKLVGVPGVKALTGTEDPRTVDFLLIAQASIPARTSEEFATLARVASQGSQATVPFRLIAALGPSAGYRIVGALVRSGARKFAGFPGNRFWTTVPYALGPAAVKYRLVPHKDTDAPSPDREMYGTHARIHARLGFAWDLQAQAWQDDKRTPIEDPTVEWLESDAPFETLGTLRVHPQDADTAEGKATIATVEGLSFDPWHTLASMRPLGDLNRARKVVYFRSVTARKALPEPTEVT